MQLVNTASMSAGLHWTQCCADVVAAVIPWGAVALYAARQLTLQPGCRYIAAAGGFAARQHNKDVSRLMVGSVLSCFVGGSIPWGAVDLYTARHFRRDFRNTAAEGGRYAAGCTVSMSAGLYWTLC